MLFIPGIKGSELFAGSHKVWFPQTIDDLKIMNIANQNIEAKSLLSSVSAYTLFEFKVYSDFIQAFSPKEMSFFPYDWRRSLFDHVENLVNKIAELAVNDGVILVAHSMGGLLAKLAILELASQKRSKLVKKLITIGTPWLGAPDAYKVLTYGEPGLFEGLGHIFPIYSEERTRSMSRLFPSVYQLLPHDAYFNAVDGKFFDTADYINVIMNVQGFFNEEYKETPDQPTIDVWKNYMQPLQQAMAKSLPEEIEHDCLIGYGYATLYKVPDNRLRNAFMFKEEAIFNNGDGVVPIRSAEPPHVANRYFFSGKHSKLCCYNEVIDFVKWSASEKIQPIPTGIERNNNITSKLKNGKLAKIMCPVEATILDSNGLYVAGVFDPSVPGVSPILKDQSVELFTLGESKYMFIEEDLDIDLSFEINAYKTGVADVSIQLLDEEETTEIAFEPLPVSQDTTAILKLNLSNEAEKSNLTVEGREQKKKVRKVKKPVSTGLPPIPKISISVSEGDAEVKKSSRRGRKIFSGPVKLKVSVDNKDIIDEIFYSVNNQSPHPYEEEIILPLETGDNVIKVFAKDIYKRPTDTSEVIVTIDNVEPTTKLYIKIDPEAVSVMFNPVSSGSKVSTFYSVMKEGNSEEEKWNDAVENKQIIIPELNALRTKPSSKVTLAYYSENEFKIKEVLKLITFSLGRIPEAMWSENVTTLTPRIIAKNLFGNAIDEMQEPMVYLHSKGLTETEMNSIIPDDVKGVKFVFSDLVIEVMYSEKYSLYFSGPPTEVLEVGQVYTFSFELLTERSKEHIVNSDPKAILRPMGIGAKNLPHKQIDLTVNEGVFYGRFKVDDTFLKFRHKLVITDSRNSNPPLREIPLILKGENNQ
ncbi:hypothetical protein NST23_18600 [Brevibacillus sp. FSL K6-0770]|uniref:lipase/acyltransferase domain-containing protein n=1 Tax=Brevibacillus sp. FSL K6-0770 TaxID=2954673 RepID=UPI0030F9B3B9